MIMEAKGLLEGWVDVIGWGCEGFCINMKEMEKGPGSRQMET